MTNTPDKSELLPCPFCGGETVRQFHPFEQRGYVIDCNRCNGGFHNIPKDQAVKRWNTRASSRPADQVPDMVGKVLREALAFVEEIERREDTHYLVGGHITDAIAALQTVPVASEVGMRELVDAVGETLDKDFGFWSSPTQSERRSRLYNAWKAVSTALKASGEE